MLLMHSYFMSSTSQILRESKSNRNKKSNMFILSLKLMCQNYYFFMLKSASQMKRVEQTLMSKQELEKKGSHSYSLRKSREISMATKIGLFNSNVMAVLLYGDETQRTTKTDIRNVQTFINSCLHRILFVHLASNLQRSKQSLVEEEIRKRWGWIGH